jgi:anti-anti-sigma factor
MTSGGDTFGLSPSILEISVERDGDTQRVIASGELDISTAPLVEARFHAVGPETVVLDLRSVTFIDSAGLRTIVEAHEMFGERLTIMPSQSCIRLFEIIGMLDRLPLVYE